jgi:hypothetical protein
VKLLIDVEEKWIEGLVRYAIIHGWSREEPKKVWKIKDQKEALKYAIETLVESLGGNDA